MNKIKKYLLMFLILVLPFSIKAEEIISKGEIFLEKTAIKEDSIFGRSATVKLKVTADGFTKVNKTDVVLVLDESSSMNGDKIKAVKASAIDLINTLITDETKDSVRVAIASFGTTTLNDYSISLTNNKELLINKINSIPNNSSNNGTNIHSGLKTAYNYFSNEETNKIIILLSDGEPNRYDGTNVICNDNNNTNSCRINIDGTEYRKTVPVTTAYATSIKDEITIYTIGFDITNNNNAKTILNNIASSSPSYLANNYDSLKEAFNLIAQKISLVATSCVVKDTVPIGFDVEQPSFVTKKANENGTTTLIWNIGDIKSTNEYILEYKLIAKDIYYGSMFTNIQATLEAIPVENHPLYKEKILLNFTKPTVNIPMITVNDDYTNINILQNDILQIDKLKGILSNDKNDFINNDVDKKIINKIVLDKNEYIEVNDDGSLIFTGTKLGENIYNYYVETTIIEDNRKDIVKSNISTIKFNVDKKPITYIVNYLEKNTNNVLSKQKKSNAFLGDNIKEDYINIIGYNVDKLSQKIVINEKDNVINFYYTKMNNLEAIINYYEEGTSKKLANSKKLINLEYLEKIIETPIDIYGYDKLDQEKEIIIDVTNNEINFYYKKSAGKVVVDYVDSNSNKISETTIEEGIIGEEYNIKPIEIKNYKLINTIGNEIGNFKVDDIFIKYIYEKVPDTSLYIKNKTAILPIISILSFSILLVVKKYCK